MYNFILLVCLGGGIISLMENRKGFAPILVIILVAAAVAFGGYAYYVTTQNEVAVRTQTQNQSVPAKSSSSQETDASSSSTIAGWKTYRNDKYDFEFKYPTDWNLVVNSATNLENSQIVLSADKLKIDIFINTDLGDKNKLGGGFCKDGGYHVVECVDKTTLSGIHYARFIESGQYTAARSRHLKVYMNTPQAFLQFITTIVNEDGSTLQNGDLAVKTFDQIIATFKSISSPGRSFNTQSTSTPMNVASSRLDEQTIIRYPSSTFILESPLPNQKISLPFTVVFKTNIIRYGPYDYGDIPILIGLATQNGTGIGGAVGIPPLNDPNLVKNLEKGQLYEFKTTLMFSEFTPTAPMKAILYVQDTRFAGENSSAKTLLTIPLEIEKF